MSSSAHSAGRGGLTRRACAQESVYSDAGSEGDEVQEPGASEGAGGVSGREAKAGEAPHAGPSGESRAPVRRVPLTQNQLKLGVWRLPLCHPTCRADT